MKSSTTLIPIDVACFEDALDIATRRGHCLSGAAALERVGAHGIVAPENNGAEVVIITHGLLRGTYLRRAGREAYVHLEDELPPRPLDRHPDGLCFDVALSYSTNDSDKDFPLKLAGELEARGLRVFLIDVYRNENDPLWPIRYREGMFHSRFFVPVLSEKYLAGAGATAEMHEGAGIMLKYRRSEIFYPLIPLARSLEALRAEVFLDVGPDAKELDQEAFEWVRNHVFPLSYSDGIENVAQFFVSLRDNAEGRYNLDYLRCLEGRIRWISLSRTKNRRFATVFFDHPWLTCYAFSVEEGRARYLGASEAPGDAVSAQKLRDPVGWVLRHLAGQIPFSADGGPLVDTTELRRDEAAVVGGQIRLPELRSTRVADATNALGVDHRATRLVWSTQGEIGIHDLEAGRVILREPGSSKLCWCAPDARWMLLTSTEGLTVFDQNGTRLETFRSIADAYHAALSESGHTLAVSTWDEVVILDTTNWTVRARAPSSHAPIFDIALVHEAELLVLATHLGLVILDACGRFMATLSQKAAYSVLIDRSGVSCLASFYGGRLEAFDLDSLAPIRQLDLHVAAARISRLSGDWLLAACNTGDTKYLEYRLLHEPTNRVLPWGERHEHPAVTAVATGAGWVIVGDPTGVHARRLPSLDT